MALLAVVAALFQLAVLPFAESEPYLHEIAARSGHAEIFTAAAHPDASTHLETSAVRRHVCVLGCYLSSRVRAQPPAVIAVHEVPPARVYRPTAPPPVWSAATQRPAPARAPPSA